MFCQKNNLLLLLSNLLLLLSNLLLLLSDEPKKALRFDLSAARRELKKPWNKGSR